MSAGDNPARGAPAAPEHSEPSASANVKFAGELRRFLELGAAQLDAAMRESDSRVNKLAGAVTAVATDARELEMQGAGAWNRPTPRRCSGRVSA